jgi:hypothetical protein
MAGNLSADYIQPQSNTGLTILTPAGGTIASINIGGIYGPTGNLLISSSFNGLVANTGIFGLITDSQIASVSNTKITGTITNNVNSTLITANTLVLSNSIITSGAAVNAATGSPYFIDFPVPTWAKRVTVLFSGISTVSTSPLLVQLGISAGTVENTGYVSSSTGVTGTTGSTNSSTAGFVIAYDTASYVVSGQLVISNITSNSWVASGSGKIFTSASWVAGGDKTLAGPILNVRLTTVAGNQAFDAGTINILYE